MRHTLIIIGCFLSLVVTAQADSTAMLQQLEEMAADSDKVLLLLEVGDLYYQTDPERAARYYHQARELAVQVGYPYGHGKSWIYLGFLRNVLGEYSEAIVNNQRAYEIFREIGDSLEAGKALINIGNAYNFQAAAEVALPYYLEAADIFERIDNPVILAFTLGNIHTLLLKLRDYDQALEYAERMMSIAPQNGDSVMIADAFQKYGLTLLELKRYEEALPALQRAMEISVKTGDEISLAVSNSNLGDFYFRQGDYEAAITYYQAGVAHARKMGDPYYLVEGLGEVGKAKMAAGKLGEGRTLLLEALSVARSNGIRQNEMDDLGLLAELEEKAGRYQKANEYWQLHTALQDSIFDQNSRNQVAALNVRYQTTVRENRIAALETENELQHLRLRQRNLILGALSFGLLVLVGMLYLLRRSSRQRQEISRQAAELQKREILRLENEKDLVSLRARMEGEQTERLRIAEDLHDDFGAGLSKIALLSDLLADQESEKAGSLHKIADSSRQLQRKMGEIVWALNTGNDSFASLVSYLRHYLQDYLDDTGIKCELSVPDPLPQQTLTGTQRRNVFLVIKESLHNVLKHSAAEHVWVKLILEGDTLTGEVRDNGRGIILADQEGLGNGTRNMRKRMEQLGGSLFIAGENGTTVSLSLPMQEA